METESLVSDSDSEDEYIMFDPPADLPIDLKYINSCDYQYHGFLEDESVDLEGILKYLVKTQAGQNCDYMSLLTPKLGQNVALNDINKMELYLRQLMKFLDYGFIPDEKRIDIIHKLYITGEKLSNIDITRLSQTLSWERVSDHKLLEIMETNPDNLHYIVKGKGRLLRFPVSGRPMNTMALLRQNGFKIVRLSETEGKKGYVQIGNSALFSVNRYSAGMSRGLYFETSKFCGTFYYFEPMSYVWLSCDKSRMVFFRNKVDACIRMFNRGFELIFKGIDVRIDYYDNTAYQKFINYSQEIVKYSTNPEYNEFIEFMKQINNLDVDLDRNHYDKTVGADKNLRSRIIKEWYMGNKSNLYFVDDNYSYNGEYLSHSFYAKEDPLDQPICILGRKLGYDIIFLEKMSGQSRIVSEILDTRSRTVSINNLYWQIT